MNLSRRGFLIGFGGAACTALVPAQARNLIQFDGPIVPKTTIWVGGHVGEFDWQPFEAKSRADALRQLLWRHVGCSGDEIEETLAMSDKELEKIGLGVERAKKMDGLQLHEIKPHHWIRAGYGAECDRCGGECYDGDGARAIGQEAICEECVSLMDLFHGDKWDFDDAQERLTEIFLDHDCDESAVRTMLSHDHDPDLIPVGVWQKCLAEAREAA